MLKPRPSIRLETTENAIVLLANSPMCPPPPRQRHDAHDSTVEKQATNGLLDRLLSLISSSLLGKVPYGQRIRFGATDEWHAPLFASACMRAEKRGDVPWKFRTLCWSGSNPWPWGPRWEIGTCTHSDNVFQEYSWSDDRVYFNRPLPGAECRR